MDGLMFYDGIAVPALRQLKEKCMAEGSLFSDKEYRAWVTELKDRVRKSQIKASVRVNSSMLELYWSIGADIVNKQAESK
jgi:hypothetical protein